MNMDQPRTWGGRALASAWLGLCADTLQSQKRLSIYVATVLFAGKGDREGYFLTLQNLSQLPRLRLPSCPPRGMQWALRTTGKSQTLQLGYPLLAKGPGSELPGQ